MATDAVYILKGRMDLCLYICVYVRVCVHTYIYVHMCVKAMLVASVTWYLSAAPLLSVKMYTLPSHALI